MNGAKETRSLENLVVWWVDDKAEALEYGQWLTAMGALVVPLEGFGDLSQGLEMGHPTPDVLLVGHTLLDGNSHMVLDHWAPRFPQCPAVVYAPQASLNLALGCLRRGAVDFLAQPFEKEEFQGVLAKAAHWRRLSTSGATANSVPMVSGAGGRELRTLAQMQSLSDATSEHQLLKQCATILKKETQAAAAYGWLFHANPQGFERVVELRGGERALLFEKQAQSVVRDLIMANPTSLGRKRPLYTGFFPPQWCNPTPNTAAVLFQSPTGNSAYVVLVYEGKAEVSGNDFIPLLQLASRLFHHLDITLFASYVDELTGVHNRKFLESVFAQEVARQGRYGGLSTLLFLDLDHFKDVNDTFGHLVGSYVLREVAHVLKLGLRSSDVLVRYGGDEFVALMPNTSGEQALQVAERIRMDLEETAFDASEATGNSLAKNVRVTASIGLSEFPTCGATIQDLIALADKAMYNSKSQGKNRVSVAEPDAS